MSSQLTQKKCISCRGATALPDTQARALLVELPGWVISDDGKWLKRDYTFKNFVEALAFTKRVGVVAEAEQHHPDIELGWGYVRIRLQTHDVGGLHENDFIVAAKIDAL